ncbi:ABC transporter ATP-binding protein [Lonepinella sp. BR2474]|uniref:ABC transporter ATP-binding protein n=1 Tax=Lonepinella sp. BR2474 TaxID=3434548 RepID=UPI003F6E0DA5
MLSITDLCISRGGTNGFNVSVPELTLKAGDMLALKGQSGCGKSTVLEMVGLILKPDHIGQFILNGHNIKDIILSQQLTRIAQLRAQYFGFMPQTGGLLPYLTVRQNIELSSQILGKGVDYAWLDGIIDQLNVRQLLNHMPKQLSIGERQRVSFIRAIAHQPTILLADEPTASLDPRTSESLFNIIFDCVKQLQVTTILVSHDWHLIAERQIPYLETQQSGRFVCGGQA